ncbi:MAG: threonine--tRNA ligase [Patescibacteria group bacterium]|nr:threonine--tRNA ligase [Patescibacteria group bacterium]
MNKQINLENVRHSLAHVMAWAVKELWPQAKFAIGPVIENGFYYDFDEVDIKEADLEKIEQKMRDLIKLGFKTEKRTLGVDEALALVQASNQIYKVELIKDLAQAGESEVSFYKLGEFEDLCRGPHIEDSSEVNIDSFKLTKLAGAYWRGSEKNKMLTRIYAVAFADKTELDQYLNMMEEAEKRDHRKLGKELDLFTIDPMVGLGLAMFLPKGAMLWRTIEDFWYQEHLKNGYQLVRTPHIGSRHLWETSGHWGFYSDSMYPPLEIGKSLAETQTDSKNNNDGGEEYLLKPMNCPFHVMLFQQKPKSYRDLAIRWAECGTVYRYEKSGELSGLTRVRGFTQDDAHIICTREQVKDELKKVIDFILFIYKAFGFNPDNVNVYLSLRDPKNKIKYAGSNEGWDFSESVLRSVALEKGLNFKEEEGEAAFYGPKLDFKIKDALGREWQCSTLQFDFNLPERFQMEFTNFQGEKEQPYMLHRALFGSFERFMGLLIEHYAGAFPVWLSPVQIKLLPVGESHIEHCRALAEEFRLNGFRVEIDEANETVGNKIRKTAQEKVPYSLVIGDKEMGSADLAIRDRGSRETRLLSKEIFIEEIKNKIKNKD